MVCPIVFINQGGPGAHNHLNIAVLQARWWNPETQIYVIGDAECRASMVAVPGVTLVELEAYTQSGEELRALYQHFSPNSHAFELICLERWFVLRDFMKEKSYERVFHLDSDVMLYVSVEEQLKHYLELDFTYSGISGHNSFFNLEAVQQLCEWILRAYQEENATGRLAGLYQGYRAAGRHAGISDMSFIGELAQSGLLRTEDLSNGAYGPTIYNSNIKTSLGFVKVGENISIEFQSDQPYGRRTPEGEQVRFATLHFQGHSKRDMHLFLRPPGGQFPSWSANLFADLFLKLGEVQKLKDQHIHFHDWIANLNRSIEDGRRELKEAHKKLANFQKDVRAQASKILRHLEEIRGLRWIRWGEKLRFSRSARRLDEAMQASRELGKE
jgi:hypothetical protein